MLVGTIATDSDFIEVHSSECISDASRRTLWFTKNNVPEMHVIPKTFSEEEVKEKWRREVLRYIQETG